MAQIVYEGKWFTPLREAVQAFVDVTQQYVTGEVNSSFTKETSSKREQLPHTHYTVNPLQVSQPESSMITTMQKDLSTCSDFL